MTAALRTHPLALLAVVALAIATAACAPVADPGRVEVQQFSGTPSFFPQETGLRWSYLPDGARLDGIRFTETVEGPTVLDGDIWIAFRLFGGARDQTRYRQFRSDGVYLRRQTFPGIVQDFDPPIREYPSESEMRVGLTWRTETVITQHAPQASPELRSITAKREYVYTIVDRRPVTVAERTYEVYVINIVWRQFGDDGLIVDESSSTIWFAPSVGIVRNENGWVLIDSNAFAGASAD